MEFTNEILEDMKEKKKINAVYSKYFYRMSFDDKLNSQRFKKRSDRILDCLNLWQWDYYKNNKLLDLQRVNRCNDNKNCPNCRKLSLASAIHNFSPHFKSLLEQGYYPYLLTLTVPNVNGIDLKNTIKKLNKSFRKFFQRLSMPIVTGGQGFSERLIKFDAALKVLEVTYNKTLDNYHPHFHVMVFSKEYDQHLFEKNIPGPFSNKRGIQDLNSLIDIHLMKLWKMSFDDIRMTVKNYENMSDNWYDLYLCDIKEMDANGIYEVMKYTYKDTDIPNYNVFYNMFMALDGQRIRQGHGLLFNVKVEEEADGEMQDIDEYLKQKENPEQLLTREINQLITVYKDCRKISRFNCYKEEFNNIN